MGISAGDTYRVRLRSLQWASELVQDLRHSEDVDAVSVATHWALDSVYDLFEAYRQVAPFEKRQDTWLKENAAETIGGLIFIRGEKTHRAAQVKGVSPFSKHPASFPRFADLTRWVWAEVSTFNPQYEQRSQWYSQHVLGRPLWVPLDRAWIWFVENSPIAVPGQDALLVQGWVEGVSPRYR